MHHHHPALQLKSQDSQKSVPINLNPITDKNKCVKTLMQLNHLLTVLEITFKRGDLEQSLNLPNLHEKIEPEVEIIL